MISKNIFAKILLVLVVGTSAIIPIVAAASTGGGYQTPSIWPTGYWGGPNGIISCTGNYINGANQCTNLCDLIGTLINIIYFAMSFAIFIIAPLAMVAGAIMIMISGASPEMLGKGKKVLTGAVIGLVIVLCSYLIVATVVNVFNISGVGGFTASACTTD